MTRTAFPSLNRPVSIPRPIFNGNVYYGGTSTGANPAAVSRISNQLSQHFGEERRTDMTRMLSEATSSWTPMVFDFGNPEGRINHVEQAGILQIPIGRMMLEARKARD